jgi:SAM-dependent methyltransferase
VLTVDFDRLGVRPSDRLLDLGCGFGRHAFEAARRGADVVAVDPGDDEVLGVRSVLGAMLDAGELDLDASAAVLRGDALNLPFGANSFDRVIASEVLEHISADTAAMAELARVLRPGGTMAVTVPRCGPEILNWLLSDRYHSVPGGHIRIYRRSVLRHRLGGAGLRCIGRGYAHGLHSPYWWLRCLVGPQNDTNRAVALYHRLLVWDIERAPWVTRLAEQLLAPLIGKSLVVYLEKPAAPVISAPAVRPVAPAVAA